MTKDLIKQLDFIKVEIVKIKKEVVGNGGGTNDDSINAFKTKVNKIRKDVDNITVEAKLQGGEIKKNKTKITKVDNEINSLEVRIDTNSNNFSLTQKELKDLTARLEVVSLEVTSLTNSLSLTNNNITVNKEDIVDINNSLVTIRDDINRLKASVSVINKATTNNKTEVESLQTEVNVLSQKIDALNLVSTGVSEAVFNKETKRLDGLIVKNQDNIVSLDRKNDYFDNSGHTIDIRYKCPFVRKSENSRYTRQSRYTFPLEPVGNLDYTANIIRDINSKAIENTNITSKTTDLDFSSRENVGIDVEISFRLFIGNKSIPYAESLERGIVSVVPKTDSYIHSRTIVDNFLATVSRTQDNFIDVSLSFTAIFIATQMTLTGLGSAVNFRINAFEPTTTFSVFLKRS